MSVRHSSLTRIGKAASTVYRVSLERLTYPRGTM